MFEHNHIPELVAEIRRGKALAQIVESATVTDGSGNVDLPAPCGPTTLPTRLADAARRQSEAEPAESDDSAEETTEA